jgi:protein-disulfide isomerase
MTRNYRKAFASIVCVVFAAVGASCAYKAKPDDLKKMMEEHPEILVGAIEKNPAKVMEALQRASQEAERTAQDRFAEQEKAQMEGELKNPKVPEIAPGRAVQNENGKVTIVEYSDFQCPYCQRGYLTVEEVLRKYGDKVRFVFKHLPLDFHPMAMPAAKRFEAIALQSHDKAYRFHDEVFKAQQRLGDGGEKFLDDIARKLGVDMARMKKDINSEKVTQIIESDMAEARKFEFSGTPGFLVGGVSLKGAYPAAKFEEIIDRRLKELGAQ